MFKRTAQLVLTIGLLMVGAYARQAHSEAPISFVSGQLSSHGNDFDVVDRILNSTQLAALSTWFNAGTGCTRFSMNPPNDPSMDMHLTLHDASGEDWRIDVFQRNNGETTAYIYKGQRVAPSRCPLDPNRFNALQSALHT
jgi:hypothetical protein